MKDLSAVILNKRDYIERLENMVKEGIDKGTYTLTEDNTIRDLNNLNQFPKGSSKGCDQLDDMLPKEKLMLILIILILHCMLISSLFNYGEFLHQKYTILLL